MAKASKAPKVKRMKEARVDYDLEEDILYIATGEKVQDSLEFDQFVIDFSQDDRIVGLEIMDASKYLKNFLEADIDRKALSEVKTAEFSVIQQREFATIKIKMKVPLQNGFVEQVITATAPVALEA